MPLFLSFDPFPPKHGLPSNRYHLLKLDSAHYAVSYGGMFYGYVDPWYLYELDTATHVYQFSHSPDATKAKIFRDSISAIIAANIHYKAIEEIHAKDKKLDNYERVK